MNVANIFDVVRSQERRGSTKSRVFPHSPPGEHMPDGPSLLRYLPLGFHLTQLQDQLHIKLRRFLMPALGPLCSSLPCVVCFPHSHCLYSEPLVGHPTQVFQFQWMHHDFYELLEVNSLSPLFRPPHGSGQYHIPYELQGIFQSNTNPISHIMYINMRNLERPHPFLGSKYNHEAFISGRKKVWCH